MVKVMKKFHPSIYNTGRNVITQEGKIQKAIPNTSAEVISSNATFTLIDPMCKHNGSVPGDQALALDPICSDKIRNDKIMLNLYSMSSCREIKNAIELGPLT